MNGREGIIFDIQRASLHDGPGVRTTVFLKGCPLRCAWCHNPEGIDPRPQTIQDADDRSRTIGRRAGVEEIMRIVRRDRPYYGVDGGMTLSGGEPLFQPHFAIALLESARAEGIHTCLETCGHAAPEHIERAAAATDLFLFDYKATGDALHRRWTGATQRLILRNLEWLCAHGAAVWLRCPLIPGLNDAPEHLEAIARLCRRFRPALQRVQIMPYHKLGAHKPPLAGMPAMDDYPAATDPDCRRWSEALTKLGVELV